VSVRGLSFFRALCTCVAVCDEYALESAAMPACRCGSIELIDSLYWFVVLKFDTKRCHSSWTMTMHTLRVEGSLRFACNP